MNKKQVVKILLELIAQLPKNRIPTRDDGSTMDMEKFYKVPEVAAVITLLKFLKVDGKYLSDKGFMPAMLVFGGVLNK